MRYLLFLPKPPTVLSASEQAYTTSDLLHFVEQQPGVYGFYIKNITTGGTLEYNDHTSFYGASLYKLLVAATVFHEVDAGNISYSSIADLLTIMLQQSDNRAQDVLTDIVGIQKIHVSFEDIFGKKTAFLTENYTNPQEVGLFLEALYAHDYLSVESRSRLFSLMSKTAFDNRISQDLDQTVVFAHKVGNRADLGTWHDCGLLFSKDTFVVCLMSKDTTFESFLKVSKEFGDLITHSAF